MIKMETGFVFEEELDLFFHDHVQIYRDVLGGDFTQLHEKAVETLQQIMWRYHAACPVRIILPVFEWKLRQLLSVKKKAEMEEILKPSISHYEVTGWRPDSKYYFEPEELLRLVVSGLRAPLRAEYVDRLEELTAKYFPQASQRG